MRYVGELFNLYSEYSGTGIMMVLFLAALLFIFIVEKNRSNRTIVIYGTLALLFVIFMPLTYGVYSRFVDEGATYWRMFWLIPSGIGLAYAGALLMEEHRVAGIVMALIVFVLGGQFVYLTRGDYVLNKNPYQLKQDVIEICDFLETEEVPIIMCAADASLLSELRQYDLNINLVYGREVLDDNWASNNPFFQILNKDTINYEEVAEQCWITGARYVLVHKSRKYLVDPAKCGFEKIFETKEYDVYELVRLDWDRYYEGYVEWLW